MVTLQWTETFKIQHKNKNGLTAATGIRISTNKPASACFISLSFTSKKYWAHSFRGGKRYIRLTKEED